MTQSPNQASLIREVRVGVSPTLMNSLDNTRSLPWGVPSLAFATDKGTSNTLWQMHREAVHYPS